MVLFDLLFDLGEGKYHLELGGCNFHLELGGCNFHLELTDDEGK